MPIGGGVTVGREWEEQKAVGQEGGVDFIPIDFLQVGLLCIILSLHIALPQTPLGVHVVFLFCCGGCNALVLSFFFFSFFFSRTVPAHVDSSGDAGEREGEGVGDEVPHRLRGGPVFENKKCASFLLVCSSFGCANGFPSNSMLVYALTHMHTHTHSRDRRVIILRFMAATDKEAPGWALHWAGKRGVWVGGWMCKEERVASAYRARAIMPSMHVCVLAQPYTLTNPRTHTRTHSNNRDRQVSQSFLPSV